MCFYKIIDILLIQSTARSYIYTIEELEHIANQAQQNVTCKILPPCTIKQVHKLKINRKNIKWTHKSQQTKWN